jgi:hypothetical protein
VDVARMPYKDHYSTFQVRSAVIAVGLSVFLGQLQFLLPFGKQQYSGLRINVSLSLQQSLCPLAFITLQNLKYTDVSQ